MKTASRIGWSWLAWLMALAVLAGCRHEPPEQRLRGEIARMQAALEARQPDAVMEGVADDFRGEGGWDRDMLRRTMQLQLLARGQVGVTLGRLRVDMAPGHATVRFDALLTGGDGRWLPDEARAYEVETGWREEGGDWRLVSAEWTPVGEG
ncbi:nuclear transport factor 2 family protein [Stenotrophomonas sp. HITSZ_GD]|uniref:nuclear transport factor 2 family protein n=1 Tax=Stenotrophomonas sp. HITSZ_GD TaxID=3037248 RepID=UPI00240E9670|nr:nuclear transport factor 2 family protein [Stenotrophomonas sp. HITSZ_GD]MDG2526942.1 nuclear transport factor 2 family protein [Stenotrophomonas sp. HITSZ_GD]